MRIKQILCYTIIGIILLSTLGCQTITDKRIAEEYYNLGNAFFDIEQYDRAIEQYNRALTIDRNFSRADYNLAFSYLALGRHNDARNLLDQLLLADPDNLLLLESDAYADYVRGNEEQAKEKYEAVLAIDPQRASALYNLALIHYTNEEYEAAEALLETAYRINSEDLLAIYYYILTKNALEQPAEEIRQIAQDILTQEWDDSDKLLQIGILLEELRYFSDATSAYQDIAQSAPQYAEALFRIGRIYLIAISDPQEGFKNIEQALESEFINEELFVTLYRDERLLQKRQLEQLFQKYEIDIERLYEQVSAAEEVEAAAAAEAAVAAAEEAAAAATEEAEAAAEEAATEEAAEKQPQTPSIPVTEVEPSPTPPVEENELR